MIAEYLLSLDADPNPDLVSFHEKHPKEASEMFIIQACENVCSLEVLKLTFLKIKFRKNGKRKETQEVMRKLKVVPSQGHDC